MTDFSSHAAFEVAGRLKKATKIERLIGECARFPLKGRMLEVGVGSGLISGYFANKYHDILRVDAVDVADQRVVSEGFHFQKYDGMELPFDDAAFDLIVSNHVIEHVGTRESQAIHLAELSRVLSPDGLIYLAAPSKWQVVEPHFRLIGLSWIPRVMRDGYVRLSGRGNHYDCNPMGHRELEQMAQRGGLRAHNINAHAFRVICEENGGKAGKWLRRIPIACLDVVYRVSPTMVYLLVHEDGKA